MLDRLAASLIRRRYAKEMWSSEGEAVMNSANRFTMNAYLKVQDYVYSE